MNDRCCCRIASLFFVTFLIGSPFMTAASSTRHDRGPIQSSEQITEKDARDLVIHAPKPTYPYEARARYEQGSGVAIVTVDVATGQVTNVAMTVSTGSRLLDFETVSTFRQWRFKPGTVQKVRIPIHYALSRGGAPFVRVYEKARDMREVLAPFVGKGNVIQAPIPRYPGSVWTSKKGTGRYELRVDKDGRVVAVNILKSSGDPIFDKEVVNTLQEWRLRSGPKVIELPLAFTLTPNSFNVRIP
jgi:TonB family protein